MLANYHSDDSRAKIVELNVLANTIALVKDSESDVRTAAIDAIIKFAVYSMNPRLDYKYRLISLRRY
jgi:hypothetical protein